MNECCVLTEHYGRGYVYWKSREDSALVVFEQSLGGWEKYQKENILGRREAKGNTHRHWKVWAQRQINGLSWSVGGSTWEWGGGIVSLLKPEEKMGLIT